MEVGQYDVIWRESLRSYATATYGPAGQMLTLQYGAGTETRTYNSLFQLTSQSVPGLLNMTYNYSPTQNNGRIVGSVDGITGENTTYSYDALNRLSSATASGMWSETYAYDGFGNLTGKTGTGGAPTMTAMYNAQNQQAGATYDGNGNQTSANNTTNGFNAENRLISQGGGSTKYAYDPWGKRVMKESAGWNASWQYSFYGLTGQRLVTVACSGTNGAGLPTCSVLGQNVYFGEKLLVSNGVNVVTDRLGSVRANTQGEKFAYYPYGEERTSTVDQRDKFGTYFRDGVGQDYAEQRYYGAGTGRFWSPDPGGIRTADTSNPTSLNRYMYVNGDPINRLDPTGREDVAPGDGGGCWTDDEGNFICSVDGTGSAGGDPDPEPDPPDPPDPSPVPSPVPSPTPAGSPSAAPDPYRPECDRSIGNNAEKLDWIAAHGADAATAAGKIGSTEAIMLGLSALESGWGTGPYVVGGGNNYFSQHSPAPGSNGSVTQNGNTMATYASYLASALGFDASSSGQLIANVLNPSQAASILQNANKYGINRDGTKVPGFVKDVTSTINSLAKRIDCPQ